MSADVWCHKNFKLIGIIQLKIYHDYIEMSTEKAPRPTEDIISRSSIQILTWTLLHLQMSWHIKVLWNCRVHSNRLLQNSLTFPWHLPDSIHISLTKCNKKSVNDRFYRAYLKISDPWQKWWCQQNNVKSIIRLFEKVLIWENFYVSI